MHLLQTIIYAATQIISHNMPKSFVVSINSVTYFLALPICLLLGWMCFCCCPPPIPVCERVLLDAVRGNHALPSAGGGFQ